MKYFIFIVLSTISFFCYSQEPNLSPVNISVDKINSKPALIFSEHFGEFFINFRTPKGDFDYKLKFTGGHTMGGLTERGFSVVDEKGNEIKELRFVHTYGLNYGSNKQLVNELTMYVFNSVTKKEAENIIKLTGI